MLIWFTKETLKKDVYSVSQIPLVKLIDDKHRRESNDFSVEELTQVLNSKNSLSQLNQIVRVEVQNVTSIKTNISHHDCKGELIIVEGFTGIMVNYSSDRDKRYITPEALPIKADNKSQ